MIITMNKGSALILNYHDNLVGTIYFKDKENIKITEVITGLYIVIRNFDCIYFTGYKIKENFLDKVEV